jgi:hypothetical protein
VSAMTLVNHCTTDSDCPPSWDKNAIFCSTPILHTEYSYNRRSEDKVVVYDGSEKVYVDINDPETLSRTKYSPVCISYRPVGYKCKKRLDCLANESVDLPYIQCINGTCADLGKTTGNYMKTIRGNHKKGSKYWYIGLGLGLVVIILFFGCSTLIIQDKKKKKNEEKTQKDNKNNVNSYKDKTIVTCVNGDDEDNYNPDDYKGVTVINYETNYNSEIQSDKKSKNISNDNKTIKKKNKRSLLNLLSFGLLRRHNNDMCTIEDHKTKIMQKNGNMVEEIDLTNGFKEESMDPYGTLNYNKYKVHHELTGKNSKSIKKHKSYDDPERTLVRNLNKKTSKASVGTITTTKTMTSTKSQHLSDKSTTINTIVDLNNDECENLSNENLKQDTYDQLNILSSLNQAEDEIVYFDNNSENSINKSITKHFSEKVINKNELRGSLIHFPSSDVIKLHNTEIFPNNVDQRLPALPFRNKNKNSYPTPKQNPDAIIQINKNKNKNKGIYTETNNTPKSSPKMYNVNSSSDYDNTDFYQDISKMDTRLSLPTFSALPINEIIESSFADSSNSSDKSSISSHTIETNGFNDDIQKYSKSKDENNNILNSNKNTETINRDTNYLKNNYSIPTPYDSPYEFDNLRKDFKGKAKPSSKNQSSKNNIKLSLSKHEDNSTLSSMILKQSNKSIMSNKRNSNNNVCHSQVKSYHSQIQYQPQSYYKNDLSMHMNNKNYISSNPNINSKNRRNSSNSSINNSYSDNNPFVNIMMNQNCENNRNLKNSSISSIHYKNVIIDNPNSYQQHQHQQRKENQNNVQCQFEQLESEIDIVPNTTNTSSYPVEY